MSVKTYRGTPYHLWNPFTPMEEFLPLLGIGPVVIERGKGVYVYNEAGDRFINGFSSLWNVAVGHGRRELVEAATKQMEKLSYASCFRQVHPLAIKLAAKLVEITGGHYQHVYLGSNGSEAIETALKMARQYHRQSPHPSDHGRFKIISLKNCYHGVTFGATSTSGLKSDEEKFGPLLPGFLQIDPPYCFNCPYEKSNYPACGMVCGDALEKLIENEGQNTIAAFILEPIMGAYGVIVPPEAYYSRVREICKKHGILFIADEVTTGFGRTGKLFMSQDWVPQPDILCMGKAISSGYLPLSATLATEEVYKRFKGKGNQFEHGSTNSGHPVCAAVGLANIDIIINEKLPENAAVTGEYLKRRIEELADKRDILGEVRGRGLMIGLELVKDENKTPLTDKQAFDVVLNLATLGLLVYSRRNVIGLLPPLILNSTVADEIVEILDKGLNTSILSKMGGKARLLKEFVSAKLKSN